MIKEKEVLIDVCDLGRYYYTHGLTHSKHWAIEGISFCIYKGECLGIVGESSSGKTTISRILAGIEEPSSGKVYYKGLKSDIHKRGFGGKVQMIFQDTTTSLDPRMKVRDLICEPLHILKEDKQIIETKLNSLMETINLDTQLLDRYPDELSGGQRQRVCIARAVSVSPEFLICDEAVSALDVSVQERIIDLLIELKQKMDVTLLFVSHDLGVVKTMSDRIMVLFEGRIVEIGNSNEIYNNPMHPYTKVLLNKSAYDNITESSDELIEKSQGCPYYKFCNERNEKCKITFPEFEKISNVHLVACHNM